VFDGHQENLANLWQNWGLPQNTLTDALASSPDDAEAMGRFKNALQGVGLGAVAEGLGLTLSALRTARAARQNPVQAPDVAGESAALPQVKTEDFHVLGDVAQDKLIAKRPEPEPIDLGVPTDVAAKGLTKAPHEPEFFINWARIDTPDDVKNVMAQAADAFRPGIETARRGKVSFEEIKLGADQKAAWSELSKRRVGEPMSAETAVAARNLWAASGQKLSEVAELAASNPSDANLFAFRKMLSVHNEVQQQVIAARTETARALASWRIPATADALRAREITEALDNMGGTDATKDLAQRIAYLSKTGAAREMEAVVAKSAGARTLDMVREAWINGLLGNPATHGANFISNASVIFQSMTERAVAARLGRFLGSQNSVELGEGMAQWSAIIDGGMKDGLRNAWKMTRTGKDESGLPGSKLDTRQPAITSEAWGMAADSLLGRAIDGVGNLIRTPGRMLAAGDQLFKTMGYRMELRAQALRIATQEARAGAIPQHLVKDRIAEIVRNPPASVEMASVKAADYQTFQSTPGAIAQKLMAMKSEYPALNVIIPFVRTPANIFKYSLERFRADMAAGGSRQDLALTKLATGSLLMATVSDMALEGHITGGGPKDRNARAALERTGWQPYSVRIGDRYYSYSRLDPTGLSFGLAADMVEILHNTEWDKKDTKTPEEVAYAVATAMANNVMSKNYMDGMAGFFEAVSDPTGTGAKRFIEKLAGSVVPAGVATVERAVDPWLREADGMVQTARSRTPGLSDDLPMVRDLWGRPKSYESGIGWGYDAFSPIYSRRANPTAVDQEILRQGWSIQMPPRVQSFGGVTVDLDRYPSAYSRFLELAGQELKSPLSGKNMVDTLDDIVTGKSVLSPVYNLRSDGPGGGKETFIKDQMAAFRAQARDRLTHEIPGLAGEAQEKKRRKSELRLNLQ
jgi:hypothetical protein